MLDRLHRFVYNWYRRKARARQLAAYRKNHLRYVSYHRNTVSVMEPYRDAHTYDMHIDVYLSPYMDKAMFGWYDCNIPCLISCNVVDHGVDDNLSTVSMGIIINNTLVHRYWDLLDLLIKHEITVVAHAIYGRSIHESREATDIRVDKIFTDDDEKNLLLSYLKECHHSLNQASDGRCRCQLEILDRRIRLLSI